MPNFTISSISSCDDFLNKMAKAQEEFALFSQQQTDHIFKTVAYRMMPHNLELAKRVVDEAGIGVVEDKVLKNLYCLEYPLAQYGHLKTAGVIYHDTSLGVQKIAEPVGTICSLVPCTNPVATILIKGLSALKTRNCMLFLPHPRTVDTCTYAAELMEKYAVEAGAPFNCFGSAKPDRDLSAYIMKHPNIKFILATGGPAMVHSCYTSGKPAIGVGSGNAPCLVDDDYNLKEAIHGIVIGKSFDNGTICASENNVIILDSVYERALPILNERGAYILSPEEKIQLAKTFMPDGKSINPDIVGKSAQTIAKMAGIKVPSTTVVLVVEASKVGNEEVFSHEKLSPILSLYRASSFDHGISIAKQLVEHGGLGHTACIYSNNRDHISQYRDAIPAYHIAVNMPASLGVIGIRYNFGVNPTMTVGVGSKGGSISSINVGPQHLIQTKVVNTKREINRRFQSPFISSNYLCELELERFGRKALIITDDPHDAEINSVIENLQRQQFQINLFTDVHQEPTTSNINKHLKALDSYRPEVIFAIGDMDVINTAKLLRWYLDNKDLNLTNLSLPFMEDRWRSKLHKLHDNTALVVLPTDYCYGTEITPHVYVNQQPVRHSTLMPHTVNYSLLNYHGKLYSRRVLVESLAYAIESYVSIEGSTRTQQLAQEVVKSIFHCSSPFNMIELSRKMGLAISNSSLGLASAMSLEISTTFNINPDITVGILAPCIIDYNASSAPTRTNPSPNYPTVSAKQKYTELAKSIGIPGCSDDEIFDNFIYSLIGINTDAGNPSNIRSVTNITEEEFCKLVPEMSERVFTNQLASGNPRFPLLKEIEALYHKVF